MLWAFKLLTLGISLLTLFICLVYIGLFGRLPDKQTLKNIRHETASAVYSSDDKLIGKYYIENRLTIDNKDICQHVKNALIATEDSRFFEHKGLDYISLGRVIIKTFLLGDFSQGGGSTISQQLAKNLYPRKDLGFLTLPVSKIKEIFIASRLEQVYNKDEILGLYLNTVPFGENIYGIEVAANRFFNKRSSKLTPPEAATLVGMLAANTAYNPRLNPERSKKRRDIVLQRMQQNGFLSDDEARLYRSQPIKTSYHRLDRTTGPAPYFLDQVRIQTLDILHQTYGDTYDIYTQGLKIYTTLDTELQRFASDAVHQHMSYLQKTFNTHWNQSEPWDAFPSFFKQELKKTPRYQQLQNQGLSETSIIKTLGKPTRMTIFTNGVEKTISISPIDSLRLALRTLQSGFLAVNPTNGYVLAWSGGLNYKYYPYDHVTSRRQVGSTFKPIVYATALDEGVMPCEMISNEQKTYDDWTPSNADGNHKGYYSVKGGLVNSVNTVAAELINRTGVTDVITMARQMGIESTIPKVPSIALGTAELSLLEMVTAYTAFANYGHAIKPVLIMRIEDANGKILYQNEEHNHLSEAFNEETARMMVQMLREVAQRGTAHSLYQRYHLTGDYAGKTGTTQNNTDGWFIGFTPNLVAGIWVGADHPIIRFRTTALGQGAHMALPIFARFMQKAEASANQRYLSQNIFYPLPDYLADQMDCGDYMEDFQPAEEMNFFERLFAPNESEKTNEKMQDTDTLRDNNKGLLNRMRDIFRKKK
ncbi:penicillin-binding protein 1A [Geofilum sp. OHC36d9]|uniref:penicillin-binding protein 1A n=1 Tax=Geofilum sp. OHC36d9 TaxID=3458413 RepID=UPI00403344ED